jgi:DNA-binding response OmpR family regulator
VIQLTIFEKKWPESRYQTGQMTASDHPLAAEPCVLVVEDDPPLRELIALTLRREGLRVDAVSDGGEAIERLEKETYRVIVLDLMMPRVSGWDVIAWLAEHRSSLPRTVIVVTAADRTVFSALDPEIVNAIIVKPFDIYELAGYVGRCCEAPIDRDRRQKRLLGHA